MISESIHPFFQEYLDTRVEKSINRHGFVSAIAVAYVCMKTTGDAVRAGCIQLCPASPWKLEKY